MVGFSIAGWRMILPAYHSISSDLPDPCVCHTTPARPSPSTASTVDRTALLTAQYWWYFAVFLISTRLRRSSS